MQVYFEEINGLHEVEPKHLIGYEIIKTTYGYPVLSKLYHTTNYVNELKDKLSRRNLQIKNLKTKISYLENSIQQDKEGKFYPLKMGK